MSDLSSVAREAAHELERQLPGGSYADGWADCASRLPSEDELARVIDAAIYVSINPLLGRGAWNAAVRAAREVRALISEEISGSGKD